MALRHSDKRERLIDAAVRLVHERGFHRTSLADIAGAADVPVGNVYYYFKTKEALGEAVVARRGADHQRARTEWEQDPDPKARLRSFVRMTVENRSVLARSGCPIGALCN